MADPGPDLTGIRGNAAGAPRWLKVFGIVLLISVVLVVVVIVATGVDHGPRMHGAP